MADNNNSSNSSVCSVYDTYPYVIVAAVSSGSAIVSALCSVFVIGLIFLLKKHYFFIQRLVLYHCLVTLLHSFSTILRLHRLKYPSDTTAICVVSGFTNQLTQWFLIMDYSLITFTLLMTAVFNKSVARLEGLFVVLIFIFPLSFNWIPFIKSTYGRAGAWCWIRNLNYDDCTVHEFGIILRNVLQNVPQYIFLIIVIPTYTFIIIYVIQQRYCRRSKDAHSLEVQRLKRHLNEEVLPLLFFPFGVILLNIAPLINRIYVAVNVDNPSYILWILSAIFGPLQGGYIALVYTLDCDTLRRLTYRNLVATLCKRQEKVQEYPIESSHRSDSFLVSSEGPATQYKRFTDSDNDELFSIQDQSNETSSLK